MIGLLEAKKKYDDTLDVKFSTYAYYYVLGEITKYIRESKSVKLSKDLIKLNKSINKAKDIMTQKLGRVPSNLEISLFLDIEEEKVNEAIKYTQEVESLDYSYEEGNELYNLISNEDVNRDDLIDLKQAIKELNPEEINLIISRYYHNLTQTEISKETGISQVQISRKETKILQKLKTKMT